MAAVDHESDHNNLRSGLILAFSAAFLFSTKPIIIKWLYSLGMSALPLMGLRMLIALPVYLIIGVLLWKRMPAKPSSQMILRAAAVGLLGYYMASYLDLSGLEYVSAQLERLMLYAYPSMVVILGVLFFGARFSRRMIPALILTYAGLAVMYGHDLQIAPAGTSTRDITTGTLLVLGSALSFSLYILFSKRGIAELGSLFFTCIAMGSATLATFVHYLLTQGMTVPEMDVPRWAGTITLAILATVLPSFMVSEAIKRIGPARASISGTIGPVMTTVMAVILLGEPLGWAGIAGISLVMIGVSRLK